jgi:hypothetical protein
LSTRCRERNNKKSEQTRKQRFEEVNKSLKEKWKDVKKGTKK